MPFTRDNTYAAATPISADDIRANHERARKFVNSRIEAADIAAGSVEWTHIQPGEYAFVTPDHWFVTGNVYSQWKDSRPEHLLCFGVSQKSVDLDADFWVPVMGRRVWVNIDDAFALVQFYLHLRPGEFGITADEGGSASAVKLFIDGVEVDETQANYYAKDTDPSNAGGTLEPRWRYATLHHPAAGLTRGYHDIEVRVNPRHSLVPAYGRVLTIEIFEG